MAVSALFASLLLAQTPAASVDVAYNELAAGDPSAAITRIEQGHARAENHPAALINLGVAYARLGRTTEARAMFEAAANSAERYRVETGNGEWMDSRDLARRALALLDKGQLGAAALASR
jgi:Flp pilus assembly protein TadD